VRLEEPANRVGDLLEALLAEDQAVVRMRGEWLELRVEPFGQLLRQLDGHGPIEAPRDDEPRGRPEGVAIDPNAAEHRALRPARLARLLAEEVLDAQDVGEGQVGMVAA